MPVLTVWVVTEPATSTCLVYVTMPFSDDGYSNYADSFLSEST